MKRSAAMVAIALAAAALSSSARAEDPEKSEAGKKEEEQLINELFVGEKVYVQEKGETVLVLAPSFARGRDAKEWEVSLEAKYGVTDRLQFSVEVPFEVQNPNDGRQHEGLGDVSLAVNYNFVQREGFAAGLRSEFVLPTGRSSRGLGDGEFVWEPLLLASARVGPGEVYAGIGGEIGEDHTSFVYDVAGAYPVHPFVGVLELFGAAGGGDDELYLAPGVYWQPSDKLEFGIGVPIGLTHDSDNYRIVVKLVFEL